MATTRNPTLVLREALQALLDGAQFEYTNATRRLVKAAQKALQDTQPIVAHERAVGIFCYDRSEHGFRQVEEEHALDLCGRLRPGFEYLFKQPKSQAPD